MTVNWKEKILSCDTDEQQIIKNIIFLHNNNEPFELDPTFSKGTIYKETEEPILKYDVNPVREDVLQADCRNLPLDDETIKSIMFDPPFIVAPSTKPGILRDRFSCYKNVTELWDFYVESLKEFYRILKQDGVIAFKCQDLVSGGVNYFSHCKIIYESQRIGFYVKDMFVLTRKNVLWSANMENQQHARKNHCYYLVLKKVAMDKQKRKSLLDG